MANRDIGRVQYTVNVWGMEYLTKKQEFNIVNSAKETCRVGYQRMTER